MRGFQGGRPSIYTLTDAIRKVPTPALIICGDEDDNCIEPSLFLKKHLPAAGLAIFPEDRATCSISRSPRCSMKWSSVSSRWSKPAAGRRAIRGR